MNRLWCPLLGSLFLACVLVNPLLSAEPAKASKSALETDPRGWMNLMPTKTFKGWRRVPIAPDTELSKRNPWSLSKDGKVLICNGVGIKEMLLNDLPRSDGIYHVEWRFRKIKGKKIGYNSGIYVRTAINGRIWIQSQVAHTEMPPQVADLFGDILVKGRVKRKVIHGTGVKHVNPPGKWNTHEITCKGKSLSVWLNGTVVTTWDQCEIPVGHVGLQAELYYLEFRNLQFKPIK